MARLPPLLPSEENDMVKVYSVMSGVMSSKRRLTLPSMYISTFVAFLTLRVKVMFSPSPTVVLSIFFTVTCGLTDGFVSVIVCTSDFSPGVLPL